MKPIKLCRIIYEFPPTMGGSITHTIELAKRMEPYCERQVFIVPKIQEDTTELDACFPFEVIRVKYCEFKFLQLIKSRFIKWLPVAPLVNLSFGWAALKKCLELNKKYDFDIIHSHGIGHGPTATIIGKLIHKPTIWMMDGTQAAYSKLAGFYETLITRIFQPDYLLVVDDGSPAPAKFLKIMRQDKVSTVYHSIDPKVFYPRKINQILSDKFNKKDNFIIMSIQKLIPVKGVEYTIKAFAEFIRSNHLTNVLLVIIGDGKLRKELERIAVDLEVRKNIIFLGELPNSEIPDYLAISDLVVASSAYSNLNLSLQEAMACAKPAVVFDSGRTSDVIINGITGLLAKTGDIKDLSEKLFRLYDDPVLRNKLSENAQKFISENRTWGKRIDIELKVYKIILSNKD